jgi:hypothetical protein
MEWWKVLIKIVIDALEAALIEIEKQLTSTDN